MISREVADDKLAHVYLFIDSHDDSTVSDIIAGTKHGYTIVQYATYHLVKMGCVTRESIDNKYYIYNSTGHNCDYCTPTIIYESENSNGKF